MSQQARSRTGAAAASLLPIALIFGGASAFRYAQARNFFRPEEPLTVPAVRFEDVSAPMGIDFVYRAPNLGSDLKPRTLKYIFAPGVAVADFDGDGYMDFFIPNGDAETPAGLYINQRGKGFKNMAKQWGIDRLNGPGSSAISATVIDFNRDGRPDLFIAGLGCSRLFRNDGDHFTDVSAKSGATDCRNSQGAIPIDVNGDGYPDLYVYRYFGDVNLFDSSSDEVLRENIFDAHNGGQNSVYVNNRDGTFSDETALLGVADTHWSLDAGVADLEGKGRLSMYVAHDFGPDALYRIRGGRLVDDSGVLGFPDRRYGMDVSFADIGGTGRPHVYVSDAFVPRHEEQRNYLWSFEDGKESRDEASRFGIDNALWAWGAAFGDFNNDGLVDAYIANGFVSMDKTGRSGGHGGMGGRNNGAHHGGYAAGDFAMGTWATLPGILTSRLRFDDRLSAFAQNEVSKIFLNEGDRFRDVSAQAKDPVPWDGRSVAMIDTENNGVLDLIATTRNGPVHFFKNQTAPSKHWIGFALVATRSAPGAPGARIEVRQAGRKFYRWSTAGKSGFGAFSDPRLHFGLPSDGPVDVTILWPSGRRTELTRLPAGAYKTVREP